MSRASSTALVSALGLAACSVLAPLGGVEAQANPPLASDDGKDVRNAVCAESNDPLTLSWNYVTQALFNDTTNPTNLTPVPRCKEFVAKTARAGLTQKRIVMFGDWFGMPDDTPPYVSDQLRSLFTSADLILGNIEGPVTYNNNQLDLNSDQTFNFHENVAYLKSSMAQLCLDPGKTVFTVANNHAGDLKGSIGPVLWPETVQYSPQLGATIVGIDKSVARAPEITVKDLGPLRVGIVAWTHTQNRAPATATSGTIDAKGIVYPTWEASRRVFDQPASYWAQKKQQLGIDLLIGVPHWDCQFHWYPRTETVQWADELHAKGFDLIVGGHPGLMPAKVHPRRGTDPKTDNALTFYSVGGLNNALGWTSNYFVPVFELVVDQDGRTLEYKMHPYALHKVDSTFNWLRGTPLCGTKLYFDKTRPSDWKLVPLDSLATSDKSFYDDAIKYLNATFPRDTSAACEKAQ
jgi:poly-gamma-glutamate capsule biosynthesis protein CapA/YwtB (metallophosphatase superfamily)